jgi:hypothetical protein
MTLTPRAKRVIDLAYDEARALSNTYIGTEHLLLGLVREGDGLAGRVLAKLGVELEASRDIVRELQEQGLAEKGPGAGSQALISKLADRFRKPAPPSTPPDQRAVIRNRLVFVYGGASHTLGLGVILQSLGLVPLEWAHAAGFTGKSEPTTMEIVDAAFAVGGPIVFAFGQKPEPTASVEAQTAFQDQLFASGTAFALEPQRTIFVCAAGTELGTGLERHLIHLDGSPEATKKLTDALAAAGCPIATTD